MRTLSLLICAVSIGCGANVTGPSTPLDEPFTLGVKEAIAVSGTSMVIEFTGVTGDSRCPADAVCIQGGDAVVHIRVTGGGTSTYELHTGDDSRAAVVHGLYRIALVELQPYPFSAQPISPNDYRATLRVARL